MVKKRIIYVLALFVFFLKGSAQDIGKELFEINSVYGKHTSISIRFRMNLYDSWNSTTSIDKQDGFVKKSGTLSYTNLGEIESIMQKNQSLVIDHNSKVMVLQKKTGTMPGAAAMDKSFVPSLDSMLPKMCERMDLEKVRKGLNSITFVLKSGEYKKIVVEYDPVRYVLKKMIMFYRENGNGKPAQRLEIEYLETLFPKTISETEFSFDKYVVRNGKKTQLTSAYSKYKLLNRQ